MKRDPAMCSEWGIHSTGSYRNVFFQMEVQINAVGLRGSSTGLAIVLSNGGGTAEEPLKLDEA